MYNEYKVFLKKFLLLIYYITWAPAGGGGSFPSPLETEKIVVEKWCYFPELYKMTEIQEYAIENG